MTEIKIATLKDEETGHFDGMCLCGYKTSGWPQAPIASERIEQHRTEHETGELMEPLSEFRARHGLISDGGSLAVFPEGAKVIKKKGGK